MLGVPGGRGSHGAQCGFYSLSGSTSGCWGSRTLGLYGASLAWPLLASPVPEGCRGVRVALAAPGPCTPPWAEGSATLATS